MTARDQILDLQQRISAAVIGQESVVEQMLIALLANGHCAHGRLPGLAKTRTIKTLAKNLESRFRASNSRPICCRATSPARRSIRGEGAGGTFAFQQGPIFGNLILADEINRAPAKAQAALLEAMEERQVTIAGKTPQDAGAVSGHGDAKSHRTGRHLSVAGSADGPVFPARVRWLFER